MGKFRKIVEEKSITVHGLYEYSQELVQAGKEGWETNAANRFFPFSHLNMYTIGLVKYEPVEEKAEPVVSEETKALLAKVEAATGESQVGAAVVPEEDNVKPRRGRPAKA